MSNKKLGKRELNVQLGTSRSRFQLRLSCSTRTFCSSSGPYRLGNTLDKTNKLSTSEQRCSRTGCARCADTIEAAIALNNVINPRKATYSVHIGSSSKWWWQAQ